MFLNTMDKDAQADGKYGNCSDSYGYRTRKRAAVGLVADGWISDTNSSTLL
jgi:hypothetical protein